MSKKTKRPIKILILAVIAAIYGIMTIRSSVMVLFINGQFRENAGNYLPLIVWFFFFSGIASVISAIGFYLQKPWSLWLASSIIIASIILFAILGVFIINGASYEMRTVIAMPIRTAIWTILTFFAYKQISKPSSK
jgi:hypothetical membrane protein